MAFWVAGSTYENPGIPGPEPFRAGFVAHTPPTMPCGVPREDNRHLLRIGATVSTITPDQVPERNHRDRGNQRPRTVSSPVLSRAGTRFFADLRFHTTVSGLITAPCVSRARGAARPRVETGESPSPRLRGKQASLGASREGPGV